MTPFPETHVHVQHAERQALLRCKLRCVSVHPQQSSTLRGERCGLITLERQNDSYLWGCGAEAVLHVSCQMISWVWGG